MPSPYRQIPHRQSLLPHLVGHLLELLAAGPPRRIPRTVLRRRFQ
jgi:hypothetical protein